MKPTLSLHIGLILAVLFVTCSGTLGQTASTGAISGTVRDASGALLTGSEIKITNQATGEQRLVKSGADGRYLVPLLSPGNYGVEISAPGFDRAVYTGVVIQVTETTVVDAHMKVGTVSTSLVVVESAPLIQTDNNSLGEVVGSTQVESLPLVTRNFTQITDLSAGVTAAVTRADELGRGSGGLVPTTENQGMNVQGARASDNNFQVDGVNVNDFGGTALGIPIPNPDTIQEFRVQTGMYDAEYGRNAGANVDLVTRTGANQFHGDVFEFWRNDVLNANDYFLKEDGVARPELKQNQFGGTLGGPVIKNKLLFFGSYQGTRQINAVQGRQTFLSPPITNDRSAAGLGAVFAGQRGYFQNLFGGVGPAIAADGSNINPVALALLQLKLPNGNYLYPSPNPSTGLVSLTQPSSFNENQYMGNFSYLQSSKNTIDGRFFVAEGTTVNAFGGGGNLIGAPTNTRDTFLVSSISDNYAITPTLFNRIQFGYARSINNETPSSPFSFSGVGITASQQYNSLPYISIAGSDSIAVDAYDPYAQNNFDLEDNFSWVHGRNSFRFGGGFTRSQQQNVGQTYDAQVGFETWPDFMLGLNATQNGTGIFSNVLYSVDLPGILTALTRTWDAALYFQDDYKVSSRLTLNLGVRYEWLPPFTALNGRATNLNPALVNPDPPASGSLEGYVVPVDYPGTVPAGVTRSSIQSFVPGKGTNTFAPRVGFAYNVLPGSDRLVLRGGYGIYYSAITSNNEIQSIPSLPWADLRVFQPTNNGSATFQSPFMQPIPPLSSFPFFEPYTPTSDISYTATQPNVRTGITQEYTLNLQQQLTSNLMLQVAYVGSGANHLIYSHSVNQAILATPSNPVRGITVSTLANLTQRVPDLGFDPANFLEQVSEGRSNYNALEVTVKKNMSKGLQLLASYTWSKTMATGATSIVGSSFGGGTYGDQNNLYADYGPANFSRPQRLIVSSIYKLPTLNAGPQFAKTLANGWELIGVWTYQSGNSLSFTNYNATSLYGITNDHAYIDTSLPGCTGLNEHGDVQSRQSEFFNTSCFTNPPTISSDGGTAFGNTRPGMLRGPDQNNLDFSFVKITPIARNEAVNLEFRAEFFNALNTPQFANPDTAYSDGPAFGVITGTTVAPRIGQLALKLHF